MYVRSKRAGERVVGVLREMYAKLRLPVNESKSLGSRGASGETPDGAAGPPGDAVSGARCHESQRGAEAAPGDREAEELSARMEGVFPPGRHSRHLRTSGPMDSASAVPGSAKTVVARPNGLPRASSTGVCVRSSPSRQPRSPLVADLETQSAQYRSLPTSYYDRLGVPRLAG